MTWHHQVNLVKSRDLVHILKAVLYFTDQHLAPFYRLFCKIANLWDIDLKFSGFISDVNCDNPEKYREFSMPRNWISKNRVFRDFGLSLIFSKITVITQSIFCINTVTVVFSIRTCMYFTVPVRWLKYRISTFFIQMTEIPSKILTYTKYRHIARPL